MSMDFAPGKSPLLRNILPGLTEIGKIKIGKKGAERPTSSGQGMWRPPVRLDHFIVTTLERNPKDNDNFMVDEKIMKMLGDKPKRIPIRLLFDAIEANFQSRYSCYNGKTLWCSGDGEFAYRSDDKGIKHQVQCPCGREQPSYRNKDKCKINGCLSCIIDGADCVGGVWKFRTTGYNSTVGMQSSLALLRALSGGLLAGLDLDMTIQKKVGTDPDGRSVTIEVVGVLFRGSIMDLQKQSLRIASGNAEFRARLANVEKEAIKLIGVDAELVDQAADIVEEFHPPEEPPPPLAAPEQEKKPEPIQAAGQVKPEEEKPRRGRRKTVAQEPPINNRQQEEDRLKEEAATQKSVMEEQTKLPPLQDDQGNITAPAPDLAPPYDGFDLFGPDDEEEE